MREAVTTPQRDRPLLAGAPLYYLFVAFLVVCFLGGGGSRDDILSLLYLRPIAALCLVAFAAIPGSFDWRSVRVPFWLLSGFALVTAIQLIPLPPAVWTSLGGRTLFAEGAQAVGIAQPWRPISLAPDLTRNALAAMIVPFAALIGLARLDRAEREGLLTPIILLASASMLLAVLQLAGGASSPFYLYRITNEGAAVGAFANRNHQAIMLAITLPMLGLWATRMRGDPQTRRIKRACIALLAMLTMLMLIVTGSRAGLVLGGLAAVWAAFQYLRTMAARRGRPMSRRRSLLFALGAMALVGGALSYLAFGHAEALRRLFGLDVQGDLRVQLFPLLADMARTYLPFGSGIGSFDPVFRSGEPFDLLSIGYLNHAHDDLMELAITAGVPGLLLLAVLVGWWGWKSMVAVREDNQQAVLGAVVILLLFAMSLVDYPLRTPFVATIFMISCAWLGDAGGRREIERDEPASLRSL